MPGFPGERASNRLMSDNDKKTPAPRPADPLPVAGSSRREINAFLNRVKAAPAVSGGRGRLIFSLDATMSRQPTWDAAC